MATASAETLAIIVPLSISVMSFFTVSALNRIGEMEGVLWKYAAFLALLYSYTAVLTTVWLIMRVLAAEGMGILVTGLHITVVAFLLPSVLILVHWAYEHWPDVGENLTEREGWIRRGLYSVLVIVVPIIEGGVLMWLIRMNPVS